MNLRHRLTSSRLGLARRCAWWARPDADFAAGDASSAALVGTAVHEVADAEAASQAEGEEDFDEDAVDARFRILMGGAEADAGEGLAPAERRQLAALAAVWRAWWAEVSRGLSDVQTEQPFAIGRLAGRALPKGAARDYSAAALDEIPGTADVVAFAQQPLNDGEGVELEVVSGGDLVVIDYKTGRGPHRYVDHEEQLRMLGAAAADEHHVDGAVVGVAWLTPDGVRWDARRLDALELAIVREQLEQLLDSVEGAEARPGLHCDELYCPAAAVCPATRALLLGAGVELEHRRRLPVLGPIASNEQALAVLVAAPLVEKWLAERVSAAKAFAEEHQGVKAPDGRVFSSRLHQKEEPRLEATGAEDALRDALRSFGAEAADAIKTKTSTTWGAIKEALRPAVKKGTLTDATKQVRQVMREAGAVKKSEYPVWEWRKA